jgi:hypothetical protein
MSSKLLRRIKEIDLFLASKKETLENEKVLNLCDLQRSLIRKYLQKR